MERFESETDGTGTEADAEAEVEGEAGHWRSFPHDSSLVELPASEASDGKNFLMTREIFEKLYPYQRAGVAWMARLWLKGQGGILGDEMGLGKTVQICALLHGLRKSGATHAVFLLPVTLIDQWAREARLWCPGWPVYVYYGTIAQRAQALRRIRRPEGGILLTSYSLMSNIDCLFDVPVCEELSPQKKRGGRRVGCGLGKTKRRRLDDDDGRDEEESDEAPVEAEVPPSGYPEPGETRPWDLVVCDEAHRMKNISTLLGKSLRQLRGRSRLLLTGTPVQNALQDLWSLMDFCQPGLLGNHATFVNKFSAPIDKGSVRGACPFAVQLKNHLAAQLRELIGPHFLRRTKLAAGLLEGEEGAGGDGPTDVATEDGEDGVEEGAQAKKLPPKKETIIWLTPAKDQIDAYKKILEKSEVIREACAKTKLGIEVFRAIGVLKRLCNHPLLLLPTAKASDWADLLSECTTAAAKDAAGADATGDSEGLEIAPSDITSEASSTGGAAGVEQDDGRAGRAAEMMLRKMPRSTEALLEQSAKLRCLQGLLPALVSRGHRVLLFSQSLKMLDLIQICVLKPKGLRCLRIDGHTDALTRAEKVAKFQQQQSRFQCMLMTSAVGGVGLNLTSADRVIIVDPAWNPATDAQAVDRAFRIGQTREVRVYRLIMSGLIEDKMFRLQVFKMGLTKTALEADQQQRYFTSREIRALFEWTDPAMGETRQLLLDKHGGDSDVAIRQAAEEDGSTEGWLAPDVAVGVSDFGQLYGAMAVEDEPDDACAAQVEEAKQKLGAAEEKLQRMGAAKHAAEAHREAVAKELEEIVTSFELLKEKKLRAEDVLRERRGELTQARRAEAAAQARQEKAARARTNAQDQQLRARQTTACAKEVADMAYRSLTEVGDAARAAEEVLTKACADGEAQFAIVDDAGRAVGQGAVDAAVDRLRKAQKAAEKLRGALATTGNRQAELEAAEEDLLKADESVSVGERTLASLGDAEAANMQDALARKKAELEVKSREKDRQKAEQAHAKALQKAESSRDAVTQCLQGFQEAGIAFAESFRKTENRPVRADQVKSAISASKAAFRQLPSMWVPARKGREEFVKAAVKRRKVVQKALATASAEVEVDRAVAEAEREYTEAAAEDEARREDRRRCEEELASAEAARGAVEAEEAETKRKRDDLKAAQPTAKEAVRNARAAEKEAAMEQQQLHNAFSKVEKAQMHMEEAKQSSIQALQAEEYDASQVVQAYEKSKKA